MNLTNYRINYKILTLMQTIHCINFARFGNNKTYIYKYTFCVLNEILEIARRCIYQTHKYICMKKSIILTFYVINGNFFILYIFRWT